VLEFQWLARTALLAHSRTLQQLQHVLIALQAKHPLYWVLIHVVIVPQASSQLQLQLTFVKAAQRVNMEQASAFQGLQWTMPVSCVLQEGTQELLEMLIARTVNQANSFPQRGQLLAKAQHVLLGRLV
jgi:hypothetical protein